MPDITITLPTYDDIDGVIRLSERYHIDHLTADQQRLGFLGKLYTTSELTAIIDRKEIVVAKQNGTVQGFYLIGDKRDVGAMIYQRNRTLPIFDQFDKHREDIAYPTQVCIDSSFRGGDLFARMLQALAAGVSDRYHAIYCSISNKNIASQRAHLKAGWQLVNEFEERKFYCYFTCN